MSGRREETTMQNENQTPNLTAKEKETIEKTAQQGKELAHTATEKGKEILHDTRETVAKTVRPGDPNDQKDQVESPDLVEKGKQMMDDATEKGKEVLHETRETVADVVEPEDTKHAREEANKSMLEKGKDYVNSAAESISGMLSTDKKEDDKKENDKQ